MKIGIDLGGSHIAVGIVTEDGKLLAKQEKNVILVSQNNKKELIRDTIVSLINNALRQIQIPIFLIEEIGIGIPGITNENKIVKCEKFGIKEWDLAKELEEFYGVPTKLRNDAICAAIGEKTYGNLKDIENAVFLCLGTGIGGATILYNKVFSSEYGHMVIEIEGKKCHCGKQGCFETYCSMKTFKEEIIKILNLKNETTSEILLSILKQEKNNNKVNEYIDKYIETLLIGISNIINIIKPERICIGGSFTYFKEILYKRLLEKYINITCQFEKPKIVLAKLENTAGIIGATL